MEFEIEFHGHENIRSNHQKTIEITKEADLTPSGDCIVGVRATAACADLPESLKDRLRMPDSNVKFVFEVESYRFVVHGTGHADLSLSHSHDIVIRKSGFVCPRTLAIKCDKASDVMPRKMIRLLQDPQTRGRLIISAD